MQNHSTTTYSQRASPTPLTNHLHATHKTSTHKTKTHNTTYNATFNANYKQPLTTQPPTRQTPTTQLPHNHLQHNHIQNKHLQNNTQNNNLQTTTSNTTMYKTTKNQHNNRQHNHSEPNHLQNNHLQTNHIQNNTTYQPRSLDQVLQPPRRVLFSRDPLRSSRVCLQHDRHTNSTKILHQADHSSQAASPLEMTTAACVVAQSHIRSWISLSSCMRSGDRLCVALPSCAWLPAI